MSLDLDRTLSYGALAAAALVLIVAVCSYLYYRFRKAGWL